MTTIDCTHTAGVCDHLVCPRETARQACSPGQHDIRDGACRKCGTPVVNGPASLALPDRKRGQIWLKLRDGVVVGAMGSEPERFIGLTESDARHLARYGGIAKKMSK